MNIFQSMKYNNLLGSVSGYIVLFALSFTFFTQNLKTKAGNPDASFVYSLPVPFAPVSTSDLKTGNKPAFKVAFGKYGCTATKYRNGSYEYIPKGSFTLGKDGKYIYSGFDKPSIGTFTRDKKGNLFFKGGYFDGGIAERIDPLNNYLLLFPANPDNRWICRLVINN